MKIAINIVLLALAGVLIYALVESIRVPIEFKNTREMRETAVRARLKEIVELQKMYKDLRGVYAGDFDTLAHALLNDSFTVEKTIGDKYDTTIVATTTMVRFPARDSLAGFLKKYATTASQTADLNAYFQEIRYIPYSRKGAPTTPATARGEKEFEIIADSIGLSSGSGVVIQTPTFEVRTPLKGFLAEYDSSYIMYDKRYDPAAVRKVGDLSKPSVAGNW